MEVAEKEYTEDMQKLYIEFLLSDPELYARCQAIIDAEYLCFSTSIDKFSFASFSFESSEFIYPNTRFLL